MSPLCTSEMVWGQLKLFLRVAHLSLGENAIGPGAEERYWQKVRVLARHFVGTFRRCNVKLMP